MTPRQQLDAFIRKYPPEVAAVARGALARMRKRFAGAHALVYDNYNALAIGFASTERASSAMCSIALYPRWVNLFFLNGATLPDPDRRLRGQGTRVRSIRLENASTLEEPAVRQLLAEAISRIDPPLDPARRGRVIIKAVSARQRARRPRG